MNSGSARTFNSGKGFCITRHSNEGELEKVGVRGKKKPSLFFLL